jgi:hypothetical protein
MHEGEGEGNILKAQKIVKKWEYEINGINI